MNENIDLTKILKDCPIGWEFYSSIHGDVTFRGIETDSEWPVKFFYFVKNDSKKVVRVSISLILPEASIKNNCFKGLVYPG